MSNKEIREIRAWIMAILIGGPLGLIVAILVFEFIKWLIT